MFQWSQTFYCDKCNFSNATKKNYQWSKFFTHRAIKTPLQIMEFYKITRSTRDRPVSKKISTPEVQE